MDSFQLEILYEDDDLIVINKPEGLLTHPSWLTKKGTENVASILKQYFKGEKVFTVHRLDRATSGALMIAKNKLTAQRLSEDFANHKVVKTYLCVVRGYAPKSATIDHPLKYQHDKKAEPFAANNHEPQSAVTSFERLATVQLPIAVGKWPTARYSLVKATPLTGRKHQLRRHFKHLLCPIIGDTNYGEGRHNTLFREHFKVNRLLLMATSLRFEHPTSGNEMIIKAPLSPQVLELFSHFEWFESDYG